MKRRKIKAADAFCGCGGAPGRSSRPSSATTQFLRRNAIGSARPRLGGVRDELASVRPLLLPGVGRRSVLWRRMQV